MMCINILYYSSLHCYMAFTYLKLCFSYFKLISQYEINKFNNGFKISFIIVYK